MKFLSQILLGALFIRILIYAANYLGISAFDFIEIKIRNKANDLAKFVAQKIKNFAKEGGEVK